MDVARLGATLGRLRREGFTASGDLTRAVTSDEEGGAYNGVQWLLKEHRELIDAEYCINADSGGGQIKDGKRLFMGVQAAEKTYASYRLTVQDRKSVV